MLRLGRIPLAVAAGLALLHPHLGDVEVYRAAGRAVYADGHHLYDFRISGRYGFTYPPFAALLLAAIAWLPAQGMFAALTAGSLIGANIEARCCGSRWASFALASQPIVASIAWGQVNLVLAALILYDLMVLRRGVLIGLAAAVKLTPGLFMIHLLVCGRRREAVTALLAFGAATGLGGIALPGASLRYWTHDVLVGRGVGGFDHVGNQSIRGWAERFAPYPVAVWALLALACGVVGLRWARAVCRDGNEVLAAGLIGVTACLVSPVSWTHHWVWCVPLIASAARMRPGVASVLAAVFVLPVLAQPAAVYALAVPAVGLACTLRGRVLNLNWHSARLSANRWCVEARPEGPSVAGVAPRAKTSPQE